MAVITSGSFAKALWPGVDMWFNETEEEHTVEYTDLFYVKTSNKQFEQGVGQSKFGLAVVKAEGAGISYDSAQQTYINQFDPDVYALGYQVTKESYTDNQYDLSVFREDARALGFSMRQTKEHVHANVLNNGFSATQTMGANSDGVALFSASHPVGPFAANQSNLSTAGDLSEAVLESMLIDIMNTKNPRGLNIALMADCLVIPPQLYFVAERLLGSTLQPGTGNNDINVINANGKFPGGLKVNHYLTDTDAFFITTSLNKTGQGLVCYDRWPLDFSIDNDFDTMNAKFKAVERYSVGWLDFRAIRGNAGI